MSEVFPESDPSLGSELLTPEQLSLVADVLGSALVVSESNMAAGYDERRELAWDTLDTVFAMQDSLTNRRGGKVVLEDRMGWRPNATQLEELREELAPVQRRLRMLRGAEKCLKDEAFIESLPGTPLRWNQDEIVDGTASFALYAPRTTPEGGKSGAIVSATGSGKTAAIAKAATMLKYGELKQDPTRILVLEPTQDLVVQTVGAKGDRGFGRFAPQLDVGEYYQHKKDLKKDVVVMCFPSFMQLVEQGKMPYFDVVIVDEAHLALAEKMGGAIREYSKDKYLILATATDKYSAERTIFEIAEHEIYRMELLEAIKRGVLAPARAYLLEAEPVIDPATLPTEAAERKKAIRVARFRARLHAALPYIRKEIERGVGVFVKVPPGNDTGHAVDYAKMLNDVIAFGDEGMSGRMNWIKADPVSGSRKRQTRRERYEIIQKFDEGTGDVLVSVRLLREGIDVPHNKAFFNCDPGESEVDQKQWMGRSLRLTVHPVTRKPIEAHLYDFADKELGDRQATAVKILKTKSGQAVKAERSYDEEAEAARRRRQVRRQPEAVKIEGIDVATLGEVAVGHDRNVRTLIEAGALSVATATFANEILDLATAAKELGIPPRELGKILDEIGSSRSEINRDDLALIREMFPERIKLSPLPRTGWVDIRDIHQNIVQNAVTAVPRLLGFLGTVRANGIPDSEYAAPYGKARFFNHDQVNEIRAFYRLPPLSEEEIRGLSVHRREHS